MPTKTERTFRLTGDIMSEPTCGKCGQAMTPANARLRPELFLHDECLPDDLKPRVMAVASQESPGPQTIEEATCFHEGYLAGATAYAAAIGHSGLKSENEVLRALFEKHGWETIETFERLTGRTV